MALICGSCRSGRAPNILMGLIRALVGLVLVLVLMLGTAEATFYPLPKTWSVVNDESLNVVVKSGDSIRTVLLDRDYNNFALAFFDVSRSSSSPGELFVLGIVTMPYIDPALWNVVWSANWDNPVRRNATVGFKEDGNLALWSETGAEVWSTAVTGGVRVAGLAMEKTGNLMLVDSSNRSKWTSFDHPSDTILPGQRLAVGASLASKPTRDAGSRFQLKVESAGLALYATSSQQAAPYWIFSLSLRQDLRGILATCVHPAMVVLDYKQGLLLTFDESSTTPAYLVNSSVCGKPRSQKYNSGKVVLSNSRVPSAKQFVRLDGDGNLQLYEYSQDDAAWRVAASVINSACDLPGRCGSYGICDEAGGATCSCGATFVPVDPDDPARGCAPVAAPAPAPAAESQSLPPACSESDEHDGGDDDELQLSNVDYFATRFVAPNCTSCSVDECGDVCRRSCSCSAAFHHNDTGACFLVDDVLGLRGDWRAGYSARLKLAAARRSAALEREAAAPAGAPGPVEEQPGARRTGTISRSTELAIGLSAGLGGAGLLALFFVYTLYRIAGRRKNVTQVRRLPDEGEDGLLDSLPGLPPRYSLKELQMATIGFHTKLGTGGFGTVYEGVLVDGTKVAVKRLEGLRQAPKEFRAEVAALGNIHHANLVRLRGFCAEGGHRLLVYEFMAKGSLDKWLFVPKDATDATDAFCLDWNTRFKIALGTARGLAYLHDECSVRIIHMDVKPQNILLDADFFPKVADFGLSKMLDHEDSGLLSGMRGTPGYLAPELLLRSQVSEKSDIYSFGIVLIELLTGRKSIDMFMEFDSEYFPSWAMNMARDGRLRDALDKRMGDLVPEIQLQRVISIAYWCVHRDHRRRPSMKEVVLMLENLIGVPAIPAAELADLSAFKLPRRLSFNNEHPPLRLQRAHSDQGVPSTMTSPWITSEDLSSPR
ncbi:protein MpRLK-Pelle_SD-2b1 [Marchantia polymorpha subsp. ruderalis]|uniref:non-specific serine/threonine protein kinase n=2 Tax=Marchantia polymorpha TaxID=3197 RepID=A0AAF6AU27_MARPO|nr:hypothetical protein MARPO_0061s0017 [Marchantia polymorpha]BBM99947.1 hypothetical protein Mp_1g25080 [Marchantia polymorpha subsp. ruderalis]|eukprot:PTQ36739.1 hypothetical protein MARPO_0061s0017 [Marchantia polymorpha]